MQRIVTQLREIMEHKHSFIYLAIPEDLARFWPESRGGGDTTPPHFTLLFIGPYDPLEKPGLLTIVKEVALRHEPFPVKLDPGLNWFTSSDTSLDAREIAHKRPDYRSEARMAALHYDLRAAVEDYLGRKVKHFGGDFKAHSTLKYCKTRKYQGPVPEGSWNATYIQLQGAGDPINIKLGSSVRPGL